MLLALGGDGRNGNREESAEKTERVGRETESAVKILEKCQRYSHGTVGGPVCDPDEDRWNDDDGPGV